jgi:CHASE2 domain-containing sensor protein/predicted Ser/Thr protein kinase
MLKKYSGFILYLLITLFVITIYLDQPQILSKWEMVIYDKFFQLRGKNEVADDIQIVAVDDVTIRLQGKYPWSRTKMAELVDKIAMQKPRVVYLDLPFPDDPLQDSLGHTARLAKAIQDAGNVVLPYKYSAVEYSASGFTLPDYLRSNAYAQFDDISKFNEYPSIKANNLYLPTASLAEAAAGLGFEGVSFDNDRYIRTSPMIMGYAGEYFPAASFIIAQRYLDANRSNIKVNIAESITLGPRNMPIDRQGRMRINFNGPQGVFRYVSAQDVFTETIGKREFSGKIIIVAYMASGSVDIFSTPVHKTMHGVEITANAVENIIHDHQLTGFDHSGMINLLMILAIGVFSAVILPRISLMYRIIVLGIFLFVLANLSFVLFTNFDLVTKVFYPAIMIVFFIIGAPTMKSPREYDDTATDDEEIDYDSIIAGTQLVGFNAKSGTRSGAYARTAAGTRQGSSPSSTIALKSEANGLPPGTEKFGRYRVIEPIGKGAMGTVYKGLDPEIDRPVALKTIRLDAIVDSNDMFELKERLKREAKAAGKLSHPNIVTIYDVGEEPPLQYIAMEYLDGNTMEQLLNQGHQWDYKTLCKVMIQVCEALDFAHERGIVHRDIKPANIMMLGNDTIKVMDFGIARLDSSNMTQSGVALGTPNYISPEQLKGQTVDRRSDIFSLGVVFYEMLTNQKPFKGDTISALIYSILHTNPPAPSELNLDVPRIFDKIIAKALAKDPDMRFQSAREMADIMRKLI